MTRTPWMRWAVTWDGSRYRGRWRGLARLPRPLHDAVFMVAMSALILSPALFPLLVAAVAFLIRLAR